jgi:16S rRNA (adenine1518-N6/adenine1519-N6)-dimethyltransferase
MASIFDPLLEGGFKFKKQFGQNFISDKNLLTAIANDASLTDEDTVLEIGAGGGTLTEILVSRASKLIAFEIDNELKDYLTEKFKNTKNINLIFDDFLKYNQNDLINLLNQNQPKERHEVSVGLKVIANLPYYITTPIIFKLVDDFIFENNNNKVNLKSITIMVQKEVAERFISKPNSKDYGIITVKLAAICDLKITRIVSRNMFKPAPNVDSAILQITPNNEKLETLKKELNGDFKFFNKVVDSAFAMRRKMLTNNLNSAFNISKEEIEKLLKTLNIKETTRAENLTPTDFINLTKALKQLIK